MFLFMIPCHFLNFICFDFLSLKNRIFIYVLFTVTISNNRVSLTYLQTLKRASFSQLRSLSKFHQRSDIERRLNLCCDLTILYFSVFNVRCFYFDLIRSTCGNQRKFRNCHFYWLLQSIKRTTPTTCCVYRIKTG